MKLFVIGVCCIPLMMVGRLADGQRQDTWYNWKNGKCQDKSPVDSAENYHSMCTLDPNSVGYALGEKNLQSVFAGTPIPGAPLDPNDAIYGGGTTGQPLAVLVITDNQEGEVTQGQLLSCTTLTLSMFGDAADRVKIIYAATNTVQARYGYIMRYAGVSFYSTLSGTPDAPANVPGCHLFNARGNKILGHNWATGVNYAEKLGEIVPGGVVLALGDTLELEERSSCGPVLDTNYAIYVRGGIPDTVLLIGPGMDNSLEGKLTEAATALGISGKSIKIMIVYHPAFAELVTKIKDVEGIQVITSFSLKTKPGEAFKFYDINGELLYGCKSANGKGGDSICIKGTKKPAVDYTHFNELLDIFPQEG